MGPSIKVIFGISHGDFQVLHMGGVLKRIEFFVSGPAYQQALTVMRAIRKRRYGPEQRVTTNESTIAVTAPTWTLIKDYFVGEPSNSNRVKISLQTELSDSRTNTSRDAPDFYFIH